MSDLQKKMKQKLLGAEFRWINEQLYTKSSQDAVNLLSKNPDLFKTYHDGFRVQVKSWPLNPLDLMISFVQRMPNGTVVADMGCGEGRLAKTLRKTNPLIKVHSFDLVGDGDLIVAADIKNVPLSNQSVDLVIFSLSLMGTNFMEFVNEAKRILRKDGKLKIAEVESRFSNVDSFIESVENCGFKLTSKDLRKVFNLFEFISIENSKTLQKSSENLLKPCKYRKR